MFNSLLARIYSRTSFFVTVEPNICLVNINWSAPNLTQTLSLLSTMERYTYHCSMLAYSLLSILHYCPLLRCHWVSYLYTWLYCWNYCALEPPLFFDVYWLLSFLARKAHWFLHLLLCSHQLENIVDLPWNMNVILENNNVSRLRTTYNLHVFTLVIGLLSSKFLILDFLELLYFFNWSPMPTLN